MTPEHAVEQRKLAKNAKGRACNRFAQEKPGCVRSLGATVASFASFRSAQSRKNPYSVLKT